MKKLYEFRERAGAYSVEFLFNNAYRAEDFIICGTRGWFPESNYGADDEKIVNREAERLRTSLLAGEALKAGDAGAETLVFLHYPPAYGGVRCERICEVLHEYGVKRVFYGHIHGARREKLIYQIAGAETRLIAADFVDFRPVRVDKR